MDGLGIEVAIGETIDNSIRANATTVDFGLIRDSTTGGVKGLACRDDGVSGVLVALLHARVCLGCSA